MAIISVAENEIAERIATVYHQQMSIGGLTSFYIAEYAFNSFIAQGTNGI